MVSKNKFLLMLAIFAVVFVSLNFVSAVYATDLNHTAYILDFANFSTTINFYCNATDINTTGDGNSIGIQDWNVSLFYNASGGSAGGSNVDPNGTDAATIVSTATKLVTITNTSNFTTEFYQASVDISGLSGLFAYNFSCLADNGTDAIWSPGYANITIINTSMEINITGLNGTDYFDGFLLFNSSLDYHNNYANVSGNFSVNATINLTIPTIGDDGAITSLGADEFGFLDSVYFNLSKSGEEMFFESGHGGNTLPFTTFAGYNQSIDTLNGSFSDALQDYSLCVFANTSLSNVNSTECLTITIDNTAPSPSLTKVTADTTTDSIKLTIAPGESGTGLNGDCSTNRGTLSALSITASNLDCGTSYSFTVTCTDYMNLAGSATTSFSTNDCSGGTGAGGAGGTATVTGKTYSVTETQLNAGVTKQVAANDQIKFTIGTSSHSVKATSVTADKVAITISSTPQTATLSIGDTRNFDLDADGIYDVQVKLNSITSGKADLSVIKTDLKVTEETEAAEKAKEEAAVEQEVAEEEKAPANLTWLWIVLVVVIIAVIIYFVMKKRK